MTRKKYINATIKLIIGLLLLGASRVYLNGHPAEKSSLLSGVDVLTHKINLWIASIRGQNTEALEKKYKLTKYVDEMKYTAEHTSWCEKLVTDIQKIADEIESQKPTDTQTKYSSYRTTIREWTTNIQNHCKTETVSE